VISDWKPFIERHEERSREKQLIGWTAAHFVRDGETIILDSGTTTPYVARHLVDKHVTVITHALPVAAELSHYVNVSTFVLGGILRHNEMYTAGASVLREVSHLAVDKSFLSCAGFGVERGIMDPDPQEAELKRYLAAAAREVILVADSSKWGRIQRAEVLPLTGVQKIITDDRIAVQDVRAIEALGIEVITPGELTTPSYLAHALDAV
jgi:DeoR/GlpR family transcriptional regulator of sugar metabolism